MKPHIFGQKWKKLFVQIFGELTTARHLFFIGYFVIDPYNVYEKSFDFYPSIIRRNTIFKKRYLGDKFFFLRASF